MCSANVIDHPPCSTRPCRSSAAISSPCTLLCYVQVVIVVAMFSFLLVSSSLPQLQSFETLHKLRLHQQHILTEHQPPPNSRTLLPANSFGTVVVPLPPARVLRPCEKNTFNFTAIAKAVHCHNNDLPAHQAFTTHFCHIHTVALLRTTSPDRRVHDSSSARRQR